MSQTENRPNLNDLDSLLKNVDPELFMTTLNRLLKEEENKLRTKQNPSSYSTPPRSSRGKRNPTPPPPERQGQYPVVGKTQWGPEEFSFLGYTNGGGASGVDCGLIAIKKAFDLMSDRPADLVSTFFADSHGKIREELVEMFMHADSDLQRHMANQYLQSVDIMSLNDLRTQTVHKLRTEMLNWQTLVQYIRWKFPGRVNAVVWKQQPTGDVVVYQAGTDIDPDLPILHVVHYNSLHFEALSPMETDRVSCAIKGRVDNAKAYMVEMDSNFVTLFVAPHPAVRGRVLLRVGDEPTVYACDEDHVIMAELGRMSPVEGGVSHSFNYHTTQPIPDSMVTSIQEFVLIQALDTMGLA